MGIYIFKKDVLKQQLIRDEKDDNSSGDFGKDVIPYMLKNGFKMYAYRFDGYWKDVGTIQSLWEANIDLIGENPKFNLRDRSWRIFSRNYSDPPHFIGNYAKISNSLITEGCNIEGIVENSVLSSGVKVSRGAYIKDSVIMKNVTIGEGTTINYSIIDSDTEIGAGSVIGRTKSPNEKITVIGAGLKLASGTDVPGGEMVNEEWLKKNNEA